MSESRDLSGPSSGAVAEGRVSWFKPAKKFGFVKLDGDRGDAFLHFNVLKEAGYYFLPRGTTVEVKIEPDERGVPSVVQVLHVDPSTAREGEPPPLRREEQEREVEESQANLRASIAETERLVGVSNEMLKRHRNERDADVAEEAVLRE